MNHRCPSCGDATEREGLCATCESAAACNPEVADLFPDNRKETMDDRILDPSEHWTPTEDDP